MLIERELYALSFFYTHTCCVPIYKKKEDVPLGYILFLDYRL